jgi:hypothetical protein
MEPMQLLQVEGNTLANLPGDDGFDAQISDCATREAFEAWSEGNGEDDSLAARFESQVFVKIPQSSDENGEFSLDYDVLPLDAANDRINRWNAGHSS